MLRMHSCPKDAPLLGSLLGTLPGDQKLISPEIERSFGSLVWRFVALRHTSECRLAICPLIYCTLMKREVLHVKLCKIKSKGDCWICKRFNTHLLQHLKSCFKPNCPVWLCIDMKFKMKLDHQQRLMVLNHKMYNELLKEFLHKLRKNTDCPLAELLQRLTVNMKRRQQICTTLLLRSILKPRSQSPNKPH